MHRLCELGTLRLNAVSMADCRVCGSIELSDDELARRAASVEQAPTRLGVGGILTAAVATRRQVEQAVLEVENVRTHFHTQEGTVHAVNGVGFDLAEGEVLGVVGESGSGKSVTMLSLLGLLPTPPAEVVSGAARLEGEDLMALDDEALRRIRGARVGFVFQDPMTSLNPVLTVGYQLVEPLRTHLGMDREVARNRAAGLLDLVGIPEPEKRLRAFPHEFSGGMRQRVMIAMALACSPKVLIADEPTTALDVTIQAQILDLVKRLRHELGMAIIWITHDLGVVAGLADRVMVMYAGQVVERADVKSLYGRPRHPYTRGLLRTLPRLDGAGSPSASRRRLPSIAGQPPNLTQAPRSCPFAPRCPHAYSHCENENPVLASIAEGHEVACFYDVEADRPYER